MKMIKKNNGKRAKCHRTPPQPRRKSLFETAGEVSKPFVITIITIVAILALLILLFFSKQFVGKAVGTIDIAEIALGEVKLGQPIEATVEAFIGDKQTKVINFKLNLPLSIKCVDINKMEQLLEKSFLAPDDITCVDSNQGSKINYVYTTTGELQTEQLQLAKITFKPLAAGTTHLLSLSEFNIVVGGQPVTLTTKPTTITMPKEEGQIKCPGDPKCCGTEKPVDLQMDKTNCGSCGEVCEGLQSCVAGKCTAQCTGETPDTCSGNCVNLQKDSLNCGQCNKACISSYVCLKGECSKNVILTEIAPTNNVFSTLIAATEDFTSEVLVYTVLYGADNKVLSLQTEKIVGGLKKGSSYTATVNYLQSNVKKKTVLLYDVEANPQVHALLEKPYG